MFIWIEELWSSSHVRSLRSISPGADQSPEPRKTRAEWSFNAAQIKASLTVTHTHQNPNRPLHPDPALQRKRTAHITAVILPRTENLDVIHGCRPLMPLVTAELVWSEQTFSVVTGPPLASGQRRGKTNRQKWYISAWRGRACDSRCHLTARGSDERLCEMRNAKMKSLGKNQPSRRRRCVQFAASSLSSQRSGVISILIIKFIRGSAPLRQQLTTRLPEWPTVFSLSCYFRAYSIWGSTLLID